MISAKDLNIVAAQLGREPRGAVDVVYRCPPGHPGVIQTKPLLDNGSPFPTTYYLTCPQIVSGCSTLESNGVMYQMNDQLADDPELAVRYQEAHKCYLADREKMDKVPALDNVSAGGMPTRVKCLHALVAHSLAVGPGVNPFGDQAIELLKQAQLFPCA